MSLQEKITTVRVKTMIETEVAQKVTTQIEVTHLAQEVAADQITIDHLLLQVHLDHLLEVQSVDQASLLQVQEVLALEALVQEVQVLKVAQGLLKEVVRNRKKL